MNKIKLLFSALSSPLEALSINEVCLILKDIQALNQDFEDPVLDKYLHEMNHSAYNYEMKQLIEQLSQLKEKSTIHT